LFSGILLYLVQAWVFPVYMIRHMTVQDKSDGICVLVLEVREVNGIEAQSMMEQVYEDREETRVEQSRVEHSMPSKQVSHRAMATATRTDERQRYVLVYYMAHQIITS
jgi:hypothetical protein